jgi:hypothetical protein
VPLRLVGSEMCIRDRDTTNRRTKPKILPTTKLLAQVDTVE